MWDMIEKNKRWVNKGYTNWVATLPCANCGLDGETTVAHHLKHRHSPHGGGGMGMKAHDFFTMPLCFECHASAHNGDSSVLDFQADFIFKTLTKAFQSDILDMSLVRSKTEQREWRKRKQFGEDLDD
jgi:hypothetical protein